MAAPVRFDESLPLLVATLRDSIGDKELSLATFVRDVSGRLSVVFDNEYGVKEIERLEIEVRERLGAYARAEYPVRDRNGLGAHRILEESAHATPVELNGMLLRLIDRRTVGADWLVPPASPRGIPCVAFASLKGGVGRSTALAVVASHLSTRGLRVLAVDLDLEAPGIGAMLLSQDTLPRFGTLDYLVENGISGIDRTFIQDAVGRSTLGALGGQVAVLPAIGSATIANPSSALAKISRAYIDDLGIEGDTVSLAGQVGEMIARFSSTGDFDVVLVDGRAGLHESTASVLLSLGAEVLLFGIDEPQTHLGYRLLLSHLAQYRGSAYQEWSQRIAFVNAKASAEIEDRTSAAGRFADLAAIFVRGDMTGEPPIVPPPALTADDFELDWIETVDEAEELEGSEPWPVVHVLDDSRYRSFDPIKQQALLTSDLYRTTFGELIAYVEGLIPSLGVDDAGD